MTPAERARRCAAAMWSDDRASGWFGMTLEHVDAGTATLALTVAPEHVNGHEICHGGVIFALADSAFAFACNSRNQSSVAQHNTITYLVPARLGDQLTATAREVSLTGRTGIYDVPIHNQIGAIVAQFRGVSRTIPGTVFDELQPDEGQG